jgi:hypothetical protein
MLVAEQRADELLFIDQALIRLAELDNAQARVVEMHFFGGMSFDELPMLASRSYCARRWAPPAPG